ncbi:MAG: type II secretion system F family protein [Gemmatimonadaceae bacterium]
MPEFWYSALGADGKVIEGWKSAPSRLVVEEEIRRAGSFPIRTEERVREQEPRRLTDAPIPRRELLGFLEYIAGSLDVGIPILHTLDDVEARTPHRKLKAIIGELRAAVAEEGASLSEALAQHPKAFPELYVGTLRAGEASGSLSYALRQLVDYLDWQENISSQIQQATMYPVIVLGAVSVLVLGLIGFVFPRIIPMLRMQQIELPLPTRIILATSNFVRAEWLVVLLALNAVVFGSIMLRRHPRGRLLTDRLLLHTPILGSVLLEVNVARFVTYLSLFYRTGVELIYSLSICERIVTNRVVANAIGDARQLVTEGVSLATAFARFPVFPTVVLRALALGESTGNLDGALHRTRDYYSREIPAKVRRLITVLQPLLIAVIGGVILLVALAIILPILNIYSSIGVRR